MQIQIKEEHIKKGQRINPSHCLLALAIKDVVKGEILVTYGSVWINNYKHNMSPQARLLVEDFDLGKKVYPCTVEIDDRGYLELIYQ